MNKILRYSFMSMLMLFAGSVMADDVVIDFNAMTDLAVSHDAVKDEGGNVTEEASTAGDITEAKTITVNGVEVTISPAEEGKTVNRFWRTNNGPQLRCYSGTITIKAGQNMKSITFAAPSKFNLTAAEGTIEGKAWSGDAAEVVFTVAGNTQMNKITVNFDGDVVVPEPQPTAEEITVAKALEVINALADGATTDEEYQVKGYVIAVTEISAQYGNATFVIADAADATEGLTVFRTKGFNGASITNESLLKKGDLVVVKGKLQKYVKNEVVTPEVAQGGSIVSINGKTSDEGETPTPEVQEITVAKALELINALENGKTTTEEYKVTGYVVTVTEISAQYGNATFTIADEKGGAAVLTVFRAKDANGSNITDENLLKVDDLVVVQGKLQKYVKGDEVTPEIATNGKILSVNGQSTGINDVKANNFQSNGLMYNIAGQVVNKGYKGLVIMNGRKFVNK